MKILNNNINPNIQIYSKNQNLSFKANTVSYVDRNCVDLRLSIKSLKLMKALDNHIENTWAKIKKGKLLLSSPKYMLSKDSKLITIEPLYSQTQPAIVFECKKGKISERITFNRKNPNIFRYEKKVTTDYGSATLKSYNSQTENIPEMDNYVDNILQDTLPQIIPTKLLVEIFSRNNIRKDNRKNTIII